MQELYTFQKRKTHFQRSEFQPQTEKRFEQKHIAGFGGTLSLRPPRVFEDSAISSLPRRYRPKFSAGDSQQCRNSLLSSVIHVLQQAITRESKKKLVFCASCAASSDSFWDLQRSDFQFPEHSLTFNLTQIRYLCDVRISELQEKSMQFQIYTAGRYRNNIYLEIRVHAKKPQKRGEPAQPAV